MYLLALSLHKEERSHEALSLLEDLCELYPESPLFVMASEKMAEIFREKKMYGQAAKIYRMLAVRLGPTLQAMNYRLQEAKILRQLGHYVKAEEILKQIIYLLPESPAATEAENELKSISFVRQLHAE